MKLNRRALLKLAAAASVTTLSELGRIDAALPAAFLLPVERAPVGGSWRLVSSQAIADTGDVISLPEYNATSWQEALVPGTTLGSYVKNGKYPEPYFDLNNKITENLIPDASVDGSVFTFPHWYRTTFGLSKSDLTRAIWLDFNGINYRADIYVNGKSVGTMAGMFKRGMFDVTGVAKVGVNAVAVQIHPLDVPGQPHNSGCGGDRNIGKNAATMYASIGMDFSIVDGVRDRNMGIFRSVEIVKTGDVRIRDPFMITDSIPSKERNSATLRFMTTLINRASTPVEGSLHLTIDIGKGVSIPVTQSISLQPNETRDIELNAADHPALTVANPRIWQPVPFGKPELYKLTVEFITRDKSPSDRMQLNFGIRTVVRDTSFHDQNTFWVNGRRTFIQGGNWTQDEMLRSTPKSYGAQLRQFAEAGVNMLRCWSGCAPESDDFFDICDRYGIMVWVESGAISQVTLTNDVQLQLDNWADTILRVRSHPSVAYYCGCNEGSPVAGTAETAAKYDNTRQYQDSSQQNGQRGCPYRYLGVDTFYDYTCQDVYGSGPLGPFGGFCNETGTAAIPASEILSQTIAEKNLWPIINNQGFVDAIDYHDGAGFHLMRSFITNGCAQFGSFDTPDLGGRIGVDNYAFKGQVLGAMTFRAISEIWKRNKWDEANKRYSSGYMLWTINNPNPMAASRLTTYFGEPNAALFYYAHSNKPVHLQYDYYYNDIALINDTFDEVNGLRVVAEVRDLNWQLKWTAAKTVDVAADSSLTGVIAVPTKDTDGFGAVHFIALKLYDAGAKLIDSTIYWRTAEGRKYGGDGPFDALNTMPYAVLKLKTSVASMNGRDIVTSKITNTSDGLAFFNRLKIYRQHSRQMVTPVHYSNNYFSLEPGESAVVTLDYAASDLGGEPAKLIIEGWNIKTTEFAMNSSGMTQSALNNYIYTRSRRSLSRGMPVTVSSVESTTYPGSNVVDGDPSTRWASQMGVDPQWIEVDLQKDQSIDTVALNWQEAAAKDYQIQISSDNTNWATLKSVTGNSSSGVVTFSGLDGHGRYVRIYCTSRVTQWGYSLFEIEIFSK